METCKNYGINPLVYLMDILRVLPECKTKDDYQQLIQSNWLKIAPDTNNDINHYNIGFRFHINL